MFVFSDQLSMRFSPTPNFARHDTSTFRDTFLASVLVSPMQRMLALLRRWSSRDSFIPASLLMPSMLWKAMVLTKSSSPVSPELHMLLPENRCSPASSHELNPSSMCVTSSSAHSSSCRRSILNVAPCPPGISIDCVGCPSLVLFVTLAMGLGMCFFRAGLPAHGVSMAGQGKRCM